MNKFTNPLDNIKIASPCSADWNEMIGDQSKRFCGSCQLNVYNLSGMTRDEAEKLLIKAEGRLCVRFYKRADGTVLTKDCPVGWAAFKHRVSKTATALASLMFGVIGGLGFNALFNQEKEMGQINHQQLMGDVAFEPTPKATPKTIPTLDEHIMGGIAPINLTPNATPKSQEFTMGKVAIQSKN